MVIFETKIFLMNSKGNFPIEKNCEIDIWRAAKELDLGTEVQSVDLDSGFTALVFLLGHSRVRVFSNGVVVLYKLDSEKHKRFVEKKLWIFWRFFLSKFVRKKRLI